MSWFRLDRWFPALAAVAAGGAAVVLNFRDGNIVFAISLLAVFALIGWWSWPARRGAHLTHAEAQDLAGPDHVVVYWRPG